MGCELHAPALTKLDAPVQVLPCGGAQARNQAPWARRAKRELAAGRAAAMRPPRATQGLATPVLCLAVQCLLRTDVLL